MLVLSKANFYLINSVELKKKKYLTHTLELDNNLVRFMKGEGVIN